MQTPHDVLAVRGARLGLVHVDQDEFLEQDHHQAQSRRY
jgi:hypothetical protein